MKDISRRDFLKVLGAAGVATAGITSCARSADSAEGEVPAGGMTYRTNPTTGDLVCDALGFEPPAVFSVSLINTGLAEQFMVHMETALWMGVLCVSPYILYALFRFISPALYAGERRYAVAIAGSGYVMFILGVAVSYLLIFPLTFRFPGMYQVAGEVANMITLRSYMGTLMMMCLCLGVVFEIRWRQPSSLPSPTSSLSCWSHCPCTCSTN